MSYTFNDGFTDRLISKMSDFEEMIYDIEDGISSLSENEEAIIEYLKDIRCSMPMGLALRRYLCSKFSDGYTEDAENVVFTLDDGRKITVRNYTSDDYDILEDDVKEYTDICVYLNEKYNANTEGIVVLDITKAEFRRLIRSTTVCLRSKMFLLSFALHMNAEEVTKFLTDVLAEQSYNYRDPDEIIAYFCHTHEEVNSYPEFLRIKEEYAKRASVPNPDNVERENYTWYAKIVMTVQVSDEQDLYRFLLSNSANFNGYSKTAYSEFMMLYNAALEKTEIQTLSNDEYLTYSEATTAEQLKEREDRINKAIGMQKVTNTEQLARRMLQCIPRATTEKIKSDGKKIVTNDFIPIYNGEGGQKSKKVQTTTLPKEITMNLLMKDRLDDLIRQLKPVDRKDLVFLKFYLLSLDLQKKDEYSALDYRVFMDECNEMLVRCGMSKLYPANRFENLILISLVSSNPFEMFEDIIEASFFNEPAPNAE